MTEHLEADDSPEETIEEEAKRRARAHTSHPEELLARFDRNGDGVLDATEWRVARDLLAREGASDAPSYEVVSDRYRVIARIGQSVQGQALLAVDERSRDFVVLKELSVEGAAHWDIETFEAESRILASLNHPGIPRLLDTLEVRDESPRLIMALEFIEGSTLDALLAAGHQFDEAQLQDVALQLLEILIYLHSQVPPVLHRDVKPANIIQRFDEQLVLVDFGAAQGAAERGGVSGTRGYMAPEQLSGGATAASDVYALGATLIHLATRRHPADVLGEVAWQDDADLSPSFTHWLTQAVAVEPEARFASALHARAAFTKVQAGEVLPTTHHVASENLEQKVRDQPTARFEVALTANELAIAVPPPQIFAKVLLCLVLSVVLLVAVHPIVAAVVFVGGTTWAVRTLMRRRVAAIRLTMHELAVETTTGLPVRFALDAVEVVEARRVLRIVEASGAEHTFLIGAIARDDAVWLTETIGLWLEETR